MSGSKTTSLILIWGLLFAGIRVSAQHSVQISGIIDDASYNSIVLSDYVSGARLAISDIDRDGAFNLSCSLDRATICKLGFDEKTFISLVLSPGETLRVTLDADSINNPVISGSEDSELLYASIARLNEYQRLVNDFSDRINREREQFLVSFLMEHKSSLSALFFLEQLDIDKYHEVYEQVTRALTQAHPGNEVVENYNRRFHGALHLRIGTEAPEIALPDPGGNITRLSSLRGKYVLIDFWAAWCGPCRRDAPNLVGIYNKYKDEGFEIFGVSLDRDRNSWLSAIESDNLDWVHVSDLNFWQSEVVSLYGFTGIPYTVLIDREGRIIAKGLRGEQLENKLSEIFNL